MWHFPMWWDAFLLVCTAKERFYFDSTKFRCIFLSIFHEKTSLSPFSRPFFALHCAQLRFIFHAPRLLHPQLSTVQFPPLLSSSCHDSSTAPFHLSGCRSHSIRLEAKEGNKNRYIKKRISQLFCEILRDSDRIQTCNLLIRSQMLYSVELRSRNSEIE